MTKPIIYTEYFTTRLHETVLPGWSPSDRMDNMRDDLVVSFY